MSGCPDDWHSVTTILRALASCIATTRRTTERAISQLRWQVKAPVAYLGYTSFALFVAIMCINAYGTPVVGEKLQIDVEEDNDNDPRAVAVLRSGVVVGHLPRETARTVYYVVHATCLHV